MAGGVSAGSEVRCGSHRTYRLEQMSRSVNYRATLDRDPMLGKDDARLFGAGLSRDVSYSDDSRRRAIQLKTRTLATRMKPRTASPLP